MTVTSHPVSLLEQLVAGLLPLGIGEVSIHTCQPVQVPGVLSSAWRKTSPDLITAWLRHARTSKLKPSCSAIQATIVVVHKLQVFMTI